MDRPPPGMDGAGPVAKKKKLSGGLATYCNAEHEADRTTTGDEAISVDEEDAAVLINKDLIESIAKLFDVGDTLMDLCVAVGREASRDVKRTYLLDNDSYLRSILKAVHPRWDGIYHKSKEWREQCKCNIQSWMAVNDAWPKRISGEKMEKYKTSDIRAANGIDDHNPDLIFNNPAVALSIGLVDVVRYHIEVMHIDINSYEWEGADRYGRWHLLHYLLSRGSGMDVSTLDYVLSRKDTDLNLMITDEFHPNESVAGVSLLCEAMRTSGLSIYCFESIISHPSVSINDRDGFNRTPLSQWFWHFDDCMHGYAQADSPWFADDGEWKKKIGTYNGMEKLGALLRHGADPRKTLRRAKRRAARCMRKNMKAKHDQWMETIKIMEAAGKRSDA